MQLRQSFGVHSQAELVRKPLDPRLVLEEHDCPVAGGVPPDLVFALLDDIRWWRYRSVFAAVHLNEACTHLEP